MHSSESVLESFVSRYENHFDARRSTNEETANEEFEIPVNGPNLAVGYNLGTLQGYIIYNTNTHWQGPTNNMKTIHELK